jgi:hypothetical protein
MGYSESGIGQIPHLDRAADGLGCTVVPWIDESRRVAAELSPGKLAVELGVGLRRTFLKTIAARDVAIGGQFVGHGLGPFHILMSTDWLERKTIPHRLDFCLRHVAIDHTLAPHARITWYSS